MQSGRRAYDSSLLKFKAYSFTLVVNSDDLLYFFAFDILQEVENVCTQSEVFLFFVNGTEFIYHFMSNHIACCEKSVHYRSVSVNYHRIVSIFELIIKKSSLTTCLGRLSQSRVGTSVGFSSIKSISVRKAAYCLPSEVNPMYGVLRTISSLPCAPFTAAVRICPFVS